MDTDDARIINENVVRTLALQVVLGAMLRQLGPEARKSLQAEFEALAAGVQAATALRPEDFEYLHIQRRVFADVGNFLFHPSADDGHLRRG
ncbi:MAG TPA: hypothetical protein VFF03_04865 [Rhodocyclaceae bacterium]|nr:hypothetical protein [Rhodocyclaceae bacterium]